MYAPSIHSYAQQNHAPECLQLSACSKCSDVTEQLIRDLSSSSERLSFRQSRKPEIQTRVQAGHGIADQEKPSDIDEPRHVDESHIVAE